MLGDVSIQNHVRIQNKPHTCAKKSSHRGVIRARTHLANAFHLTGLVRSLGELLLLREIRVDFLLSGNV